MSYIEPSEFVTKMVDSGESKVYMSTKDTLIRAFMAGAILALAAIFAITVATKTVVDTLTPEQIDAAMTQLHEKMKVQDPTNPDLWTITVDGTERPLYVGQTQRGFGQRMSEHVACMLSGQYAPKDPDALSRGENRLANGAVVPDWPRTLPLLLRNGQTLMRDIVATIRLLRFHVESLTGDQHLHDRVEGALGRHFKAHPVPELRGFFEPGLRVPAAIPGDQPMRLELSCEAPIAGLPLEILEPSAPLAEDVRQFVESTPWTFAKTYEKTWPHEYVVRTPENAPMLLALAKHIFEHGVAGRFYSQVRRYHHEGGKVYWSMDPTYEATDLVNRCDAAQTYESRLAGGTIPRG
jgi:hypothetical protein